MTLSGLFIVANIIAYIIMLKYYKAVKFENLVLLGNIMECIIIFIAFFKKYVFFRQLGDSIHITICLYILRRLLRIIQHKYLTSKKPIYSYFFIINVVINFALIVLYFVFLILKLKKSKIIVLTYMIYALIIGIIFFSVGILIRVLTYREYKLTKQETYTDANQILYEDSLPSSQGLLENKQNEEKYSLDIKSKDEENKLFNDLSNNNSDFNSNNSNNDNIYTENNNNDKVNNQESNNNQDNFSQHETKEEEKIGTLPIKKITIFEGTRLLQINLLIYSYLVCMIYQTVFIIIREHILIDEFDIGDLTYSPLTKRTFVLSYIYSCTSLILVLAKYLSFYFLVRKVFSKERIPKENTITSSSWVNISLERTVNKINFRDSEKFIDDSIFKNENQGRESTKSQLEDFSRNESVSRPSSNYSLTGGNISRSQSNS